MNERIKELVEQAEDFAVRTVDVNCEGSLDEELDAVFEKKFAELIIKECCQFNYDFLESYREACEINNKIREHFCIGRCMTCNGHGVVSRHARDGSWDDAKCPDCGDE